MRFNRRRLPGRRLMRPSRPAAPPPPPEPLDLPSGDTRSGESTEFAIPSVLTEGAAARDARQDTTVELPALRPAEDELVGEPAPPAKLEFTCACGARLIATTATYDKHSRCALCQTVLLLNLVYDPETRGHEIVPFRVNPDKPL